MTAPATKQCPACDGSGTRPRGRRLIEGGAVDPLDILGRFLELCPDCGGAGRIPERPPSKPRKPPGRAADI
jgi:DnaJ-class molecular chaperone